MAKAEPSGVVPTPWTEWEAALGRAAIECYQHCPFCGETLESPITGGFRKRCPRQHCEFRVVRVETGVSVMFMNTL